MIDINTTIPLKEGEISGWIKNINKKMEELEKVIDDDLGNRLRDILEKEDPTAEVGGERIRVPCVTLLGQELQAIEEGICRVVEKIQCIISRVSL